MKVRQKRRRLRRLIPHKAPRPAAYFPTSRSFGGSVHLVLRGWRWVLSYSRESSANGSGTSLKKQEKQDSVWRMSAQNVKRILIFSLAYYPKYVGGAEVAIKEITDRVDESEIEFHMVTLRL